MAFEVRDPRVEAMLAGRHPAGTIVTVDVGEGGTIVLRNEGGDDVEAKGAVFIETAPLHREAL